jgi:hypothetical protein
MVQYSSADIDAASPPWPIPCAAVSRWLGRAEASIRAGRVLPQTLTGIKKHVAVLEDVAGQSRKTGRAHLPPRPAPPSKGSRGSRSINA